MTKQKLTPAEIGERAARRDERNGLGYPQFRPGQKVRDRFGEYHTVLQQYGCRVLMEGSVNRHHPSNLTPITHWSESLRRFVTIPE